MSFKLFVLNQEYLLVHLLRVDSNTYMKKRCKWFAVTHQRMQNFAFRPVVKL